MQVRLDTKSHTYKNIQKCTHVAHVELEIDISLIYTNLCTIGWIPVGGGCSNERFKVHPKSGIYKIEHASRERDPEGHLRMDSIRIG